jgi:hypothetical protein
MNGSHYRLGARFNPVAHLGQDGMHGRAAKLADISTCNEGSARAQQQYPFDTGIRLSLVHCRHQATAHIHADGVDWGVIDRDDQQVTVFGCTHDSGFRLDGQTLTPDYFLSWIRLFGR